MLEILISSSVLILVLAILRLVLREKISARLQYALWLLVLVRLLVPVSFFHSPVSVAEAASPMTEQAWSASHRVLYAWNTPGSAPPESAGVATQLDDGGVINSGQVLLLRDALLFTWYAGMVVMAFWFLFVNMRLARRLKKNRTPFDYHSVMPVYVAEGIPSPCLFGLFKPSIYLTERASEDDARARQIIAHELTHYRHGDMIWALLRSVCLVVWWFNPLVWLAAALSRQDCELACDEGTIKALGEDARFDYGRTLVGMAKVGARPSDLLCGATTMTTGKKSLKERVARIANAPKMSVTVAVIVLIIAAVAVGCTFSGAKTEDPEPEVAVETNSAEFASSTDATNMDIVDPELLAYFEEYISVVEDTTDFETWAAYLYFENDYSRQLAQDASLPFGETEILAAEQVNDDLAAFIVQFGRDPYPGLQFVGRYDGRLYIFRNKNAIPEELQEGLDNMTLPDPAEGNDNIMSVDTSYWDEVQKELGSFAQSSDIEVSISEFFDAAIPEDSIFGPMTLEDYIYGTDGWKFDYNGPQLANAPEASILVRDADGRTLWIMDDADALMIEEADGSVTWVTYTNDPVDCADMIRHLLPWAMGEYVDPIVRQLEQEEQQRIIDELGRYTLPEKEPFFVGAYTIEYPPDDNTDHAPIWAPDTQTDVFGQCVYYQYGEEPHFTELAYMRYYEDAVRATIANRDVFQNMKEYYDQHLVIPFTGGLTVSGYDAFFYDNTSLTWYDTDRELIFRLWDVNVNEDSIGVSVPLDELITLAESVTAQ